VPSRHKNEEITQRSAEQTQRRRNHAEKCRADTPVPCNASYPSSCQRRVPDCGSPAARSCPKGCSSRLPLLLHAPVAMGQRQMDHSIRQMDGSQHRITSPTQHRTAAPHTASVTVTPTTKECVTASMLATAPATICPAWMAGHSGTLAHGAQRVAKY
jgi:hypothetical protein